MGKFVPGNVPEIDRLVEDAIEQIGSEIASLRIPRLAGVVLGGGYGRGEGGVLEKLGVRSDELGVRSDELGVAQEQTISGNAASFEGPGSSPTHHSSLITHNLSNDLDFYVVTEEGVSEADIEKIGKMLRPISEAWTDRLGVDVDFCRAKTPWRLKHDEERLMVQELVHGYVDVCGKKGVELFVGVRRLEPNMLPWNEAARLLVNRGAGLLLAAEKATGDQVRRHHDNASRTFIDRNINKCVLGAGDARLIATGRYRWRIEERAETLGDELYSRAVAWKLRPTGSAVCDWETARGVWIAAHDAIDSADCHRPRRSFYHAARWIARRRTLGDVSTFGFDPEVRIMRSMRKAIEARAPFPAALKKDWMIFN